MAYQFQIIGKYFTITDTVKGTIVLNEPKEEIVFKARGTKLYFRTQTNAQSLNGEIRGEYSNNRGIETTEFLDHDGAVFATPGDCMNWLRDNTGEGDGGTGTGVTGAAKTADVTAQTTALNTKVDEAIANDNTLSAAQVTKLEELKTASTTERGNILTQLQADGVNIAGIKTANDTLNATIAAENAAQAARDTAALAAQQAIETAVDELKVQNKADLTALLDELKISNNKQSTRVETVTGVDDGNSNKGIICRTVFIDEIAQPNPVCTEYDGTTYDLIGDFVAVPNSNIQVEGPFDLRAKANGVGYSVDDYVSRTNIVDVSSGRTILSTAYFNITTNSEINSNTVIDSDFSTNIIVSTSQPDTVIWDVVNSTTGVVEDFVYQKIRDDESVVYKSSGGKVTSTPVLSGQVLVKRGDNIPLDKTATVFPKNTLRSFDFNVLSGTYRLRINGHEQTITSSSSIVTYGDECCDKVLPFDIEIVTDAAGEYELEGMIPNYGFSPTPAVSGVESFASAFIIDATGDRIQLDGSSKLASVLQLAETGSSDHFTTGTQDIITEVVNGLQSIKKESGGLASITKTPEAMDEHIALFGVALDFNDGGTLVRAYDPLTQFSKAGANITWYNGTNFSPTDITTIGFSTDETTKAKNFILGYEKTVINGGADIQIEYFVYNQANPNGLSVGSYTEGYSAAPSTGIGVGQANLFGGGVVPLVHKAEFLTWIKTLINF